MGCSSSTQSDPQCDQQVYVHVTGRGTVNRMYSTMDSIVELQSGEYLVESSQTVEEFAIAYASGMIGVTRWNNANAIAPIHARLLDGPNFINTTTNMLNYYLRSHSKANLIVEIS